MNKISDAQEHILLNRQANSAHLTHLSSPQQNPMKRVVWEACAGLLMGMPLGVMIYFFALGVYCVIVEVLGAMLRSFVTLPQPFAQSLAFGPVAIVLLAVFSICSGGYFTRCAIQQGCRVFAWVQLPLMLLAVAVMCALTLIYHKPPLPFAGQ